MGNYKTKKSPKFGMFKELKKANIIKEGKNMATRRENIKGLA